ncbi:GTP cyclohydrolase 1 OS=Lysinibacillus sphaericus OX=1421 GN=folE PE=3 SV=1 [Lysinibacillus sphaericus]
METIARRPQLQERITSSVADTIMEMLSPKGVYVVIEAEHMCMTMRGLKKPGSKTVTSVARGIYEQDEVKRREVLSFIQMS